MLSDGYHDVPDGMLAMVVTHLEMHEKAALRDVPPPEGFALRQVTPTLDWYRDVFRRVGAQEWLWFERLTYTNEKLRRIIADPDVQIFTLSKDGRDEALLELDFRTQGECELVYFGLTPALIGTGAGRFLMNHAIETAWSRPIRRFHVHTCTIDSPQALGFYIRSGFTAYRRQIEVAPDPRLTGMLNRDAAPHVQVIEATE